MPSNRSAAVSEDSIREQAYYLWEQDGRPDGRHLDYWLKASQTLAKPKQRRARALSEAPVETRSAAATPVARKVAPVKRAPAEAVPKKADAKIATAPKKAARRA